MQPRVFPSREEADAAPVIWNEAIIVGAVARWVEWWRHACIPNAYLGNREADLAVVTAARRLWVFEVKCSLADWKRDEHKTTWFHRMSRFYYVVPDHLVEWVDVGADSPRRLRAIKRPVIPPWVPPHAGVVFLANHREVFTTPEGLCSVHDQPTLRYTRTAKTLHQNPITPEKERELLRKLGMRYWNHVAPRETGREVVLPAPAKDT